jgi:predicted Fe-Mo cluster-binding NifX family protein
MKHRIAVATEDGLTIHQHFGRAEGFQIVDIEDGVYKFVEKRSVESSCRQGGHSTESFDAVLKILSDCEAVVVGKIGPGAGDYLIDRGMRVFEGSGIVDDVLGTIIEQDLL